MADINNDEKCTWNPAKHDGKQCPTHKGGADGPDEASEVSSTEKVWDKKQLKDFFRSLTLNKELNWDQKIAECEKQKIPFKYWNLKFKDHWVDLNINCPYFERNVVPVITQGGYFEGAKFILNTEPELDKYGVDYIVSLPNGEEDYIDLKTVMSDKNNFNLCTKKDVKGRGFLPATFLGEKLTTHYIFNRCKCNFTPDEMYEMGAEKVLGTLTGCTILAFDRDDFVEELQSKVKDSGITPDINALSDMVKEAYYNSEKRSELIKSNPSRISSRYKLDEYKEEKLSSVVIEMNSGAVGHPIRFIGKEVDNQFNTLFSINLNAMKYFKSRIAYEKLGTDKIF